MAPLKLVSPLVAIMASLEGTLGEWVHEDLESAKVSGDGEETEECALLAMKQQRTAVASASAGKEDLAAGLREWTQQGVFKSWLEERSDRTLTSSYQECRLSATDPCKLESMTGPTLVYPGGKTTCINGDEYAFAVNPGDKDKLVFFFEGGGACWEVQGNVVLQCTASLNDAIFTTGLGYGIQNRSNEDNPFRSYTIVEPLYCSGDAFVGNATQDWNNVQMPQMGYWNALSALDWVKSNRHDCGPFKHVVVGGFSAGGLGTMGWANTILSELPARSQTMFVDSYAGVFPPGTEGPIAKGWGACTIPILSAHEQQDCLDLLYTVQDQTKTAIENHKRARFAFIQSKVDGSQIWFYQGLAQSNFDMASAQITPPEFYAKSLELFEGYVGYRNFELFLVTGSQHTFTDNSYFYATTSAGVGNTTGVSLFEWTGDLEKCKPVPSVCTGEYTTSPDPSDDTYCDPTVTPQPKKP